jgi:hypothetical protein
MNESNYGVIFIATADVIWCVCVSVSNISSGGGGIDLYSGKCSKFSNFLFEEASSHPFWSSGNIEQARILRMEIPAAIKKIVLCVSATC